MSRHWPATQYRRLYARLQTISPNAKQSVFVIFEPEHLRHDGADFQRPRQVQIDIIRDFYNVLSLPEAFGYLRTVGTEVICCANCANTSKQWRLASPVTLWSASHSTDTTACDFLSRFVKNSVFERFSRSFQANSLYRVRVMLLTAWLIACLLSSPQLWLWEVVTVPEVLTGSEPFDQCLSYWHAKLAKTFRQEESDRYYNKVICVCFRLHSAPSVVHYLHYRCDIPPTVGYSPHLLRAPIAHY